MKRRNWSPNLWDQNGRLIRKKAVDLAKLN